MSCVVFFCLLLFHTSGPNRYWVASHSAPRLPLLGFHCLYLFRSLAPSLGLLSLPIFTVPLSFHLSSLLLFTLVPSGRCKYIQKKIVFIIHLIRPVALIFHGKWNTRAMEIFIKTKFNGKTMGNEQLMNTHSHILSSCRQ